MITFKVSKYIYRQVWLVKKNQTNFKYLMFLYHHDTLYKVVTL